MTQAMAEGTRSEGAEVDSKSVPETAPDAAVNDAHFKTDQAAPVEEVEDLPNYDAIIFGAPTRYSRVPSQMATFLDQTAGSERAVR